MFVTTAAPTPGGTNSPDGSPHRSGVWVWGTHKPGCPRGLGIRRWRRLHSSGPTTQGAGVGFAIAPSLVLSLKWRTWFLEPTVRHVLSSPLILTCTPAAAILAPRSDFQQHSRRKARTAGGRWRTEDEDTPFNLQIGCQTEVSSRFAHLSGVLYRACFRSIVRNTKKLYG